MSLVSFRLSLVCGGFTSRLGFIGSSSGCLICLIEEVLDPKVVTLLHNEPVVANLETLILDLIEKLIHHLLFQLLHVRLLLTT